MRPINLIPPEDRRGDRAPTRTGPVAHVVVGALALALAGVTAVVLTNNQISDRKSELAGLQARDAAAKQRAEELAPYAEFAALKEVRVQTVDSLARSRFDWERVLRELAIVVPADVQLANVTGTVTPEVALSGGGGNSLRDATAGPALEISGCAPDHDGVAELAAALEDIDGVTRVGVNGSTKTGAEGGSTGSVGATATDSCQAGQAVSQFQMIAAFDAVSVPATATASVPATPAAPASDSGQVADAQQQEAQARQSAQEGTDRARNATNLIPGTVR